MICGEGRTRSRQGITRAEGFPGSSSSLRSSFGKNGNKTLGSAARNSTDGRLTSRMISGPQGDVRCIALMGRLGGNSSFRHTGHVGIDGSCFGEIGFLDKSRLPRQVVTPLQQQSRSCTSSPRVPPAFPRVKFSPDSASSNHKRVKGANINLSLAESIPNVDFDLDTPEFKSSSELLSGRSLMEEVMDALGGEMSADAEPISPVSLHPSDTTDTTTLINKGVAKTGKPEALVRPISFSDAKMLKDMSQLAHKLSNKQLEKEKEMQTKILKAKEAQDKANLELALQASRLEDDSDSSKKKERSPSASFKNKLAKLKISRTSSSESTGSSELSKKCFSDQLPKEGMVVLSPETWSPAAEDAYKSLIECGKSFSQITDPEPSPRLPPKVLPKPTVPKLEVESESEAEDSNPLRRLRKDAGGIARSFRPTVTPRPKPSTPIFPFNGRQASPESPSLKPSPPPIPPKPKRTTNMQSVAGGLSPEEEVGSSELDFTLESVDKYQLLDFVLAALDEEKRKEETEQGAVSGSDAPVKLQYADLMHSPREKESYSVLQECSSGGEAEFHASNGSCFKSPKSPEFAGSLCLRNFDRDQDTVDL